MSEQRCSYLSGLTFPDHYAAAGVFQGSLPAGFMASVLFRFGDPAQTVRPGGASLDSAICGNWQPTDVNLGRGWLLRWVGDDPTDASMQFQYGDGALAVTSFVGGLDPAQFFMLSNNTMLVNVFFGILSSAVANPQIYVFANGNLIADPFNIGTGYSPADAANSFRIGAADINEGAPAQLGGASMGVAGFSYFDGLPNNAASLAPLAAMVGIVTDQWNLVQEAEDMAPAPLVTDLYSVKQKLQVPAAAWAPAGDPALGNTSLQRTGAGAALVTSASKPRFFHQPWVVAVQPP